MIDNNGYMKIIAISLMLIGFLSFFPLAITLQYPEFYTNDLITISFMVLGIACGGFGIGLLNGSFVK